jgi:hypothetical protein
VSGGQFGLSGLLVAERATVTGYELRRHLAGEHGLELRGLTYRDLEAIHDDDHEQEQGHDHGEFEGRTDAV